MISNEAINVQILCKEAHTLSRHIMLVLDHASGLSHLSMVSNPSEHYSPITTAILLAFLSWLCSLHDSIASSTTSAPGARAVKQTVGESLANSCAIFEGHCLG